MLVTPEQWAGKYIMYTRSQSVRYATQAQAAAGCPAAATLDSGENRQRNIHTCTLWTKNTAKCFLIYSLQKLTDCDKIWYLLSWANLSYRNVKVFRITWIVSLLDLVKLSIRVLQVNSVWTNFISVSDVVTCEIKQWHDFKIISK